MHAVLVSVKIHDTDRARQELTEQVVPRVSQAPGFIAGYWFEPAGDPGLVGRAVRLGGGGANRRRPDPHTAAGERDHPERRRPRRRRARLRRVDEAEILAATVGKPPPQYQDVVIA